MNPKSFALDTNVIVDLFEFEKEKNSFMFNRKIALKHRLGIKYLHKIIKEDIEKGRFQELYLIYPELVQKELYTLVYKGVCGPEVFNFVRENGMSCLKIIRDEDVRCSDYLYKLFKGEHNLYPELEPMFMNTERFDYFIFSNCAAKNIPLITSNSCDFIGCNDSVRKEIKNRINLAKNHIYKLFKADICNATPLTPSEFIMENYPTEYKEMKREFNSIQNSNNRDDEKIFNSLNL